MTGVPVAFGQQFFFFPNVRHVLLCRRMLMHPISIGSKACNANPQYSALQAELIMRRPWFVGGSDLDILGKIFQDFGTPSESQ